MQTESTARLSPGVYRVGDRRSYRVAPDGTVRSVRPSGKPSRQVVGRVTAGGLQVTGNGTEGGHAGDLLALADGRGTQVEAHCHRCGVRLTDPESVARGYGSECRKAVA